MKPTKHLNRSNNANAPAKLAEKRTLTPAATDTRNAEAKIVPKKRGRPFKQHLIVRDDTITIQTADSPTRPARRVKADIKYHTTDSEPEDVDDDPDARHPASPKRSPNTSGIRFQCKMCPVTFKRNGWLQVHMQKAHSEPGPVQAGRKSLSNAAATTSIATITSTTSNNTLDSRSHRPTQSDSDTSPPAKTEYACDRCAARFKRPASLVQHIRIVHQHNLAVRTSNVVEPDSLSEIASIRSFFDAFNPQHSSTITLHLEQMFKHTNKLMLWLKRQTALPEIADFKTVNACQRELLAKQLSLYDTASQMIAAKRDSLQFAYDDFVQKHSDEPIAAPDKRDSSLQHANDLLGHEEEADAPLDIEDYSMSLNSAHFAVDITSDGQMIVSGMNGHAEGKRQAEIVKMRSELMHRGTQTDSDAPGMASEIRIIDGDDFEFLDSKTGKLFTNKTPLEEDGGGGGGEDDDLDLVELIEVEEEDEDL